MPDHKVGTREEWQAARNELAKLESEHGQRNEEIRKKRLELPWVPVEKKYEFDTEDGKKTLAELFEGRSQLLAYNVMFGPDYTIARLHDRRLPWLHQPGRWARRQSRPPGPPRRVAHLFFTSADRATHGLQAAHGLAVSIRIDLQLRLRVRLWTRAHRGAGSAEPPYPGADQQPA